VVPERPGDRAGFDRAQTYLVAQGFDVQQQLVSTRARLGSIQGLDTTEVALSATREREVAGEKPRRFRDEVRVTWRRAQFTYGATPGQGATTPSRIDIHVRRYEAVPSGKWRTVDPEPLRGLAETLRLEVAGCGGATTPPCD